jgi:hypothetical protein
MQTIQQLCDELKLTKEQQVGIENYCSLLAVELLESIKQDNVQNFDETINSISSPIVPDNSK